MVILPYKREYKKRLLKIFQLNTPEFFAPEEKGDFEVFLSEASRDYYVIKAMDTIAGGGGYQIDGHIGRLIWNMIDPEFTGEGYGIMLVNFCLDKMTQDQRISRIEVSTSQYAYKFYSKFGFQVKEHKKDFRGTGLDLYIMQKPL